MNVRFILVEPQDAGNVGAAARAMKNFGFDELALVATKPPREDEISQWWASGAEDLVEKALWFETLDEALVDCHLSVATTAVRAREVLEQLTPRGVAELVSESLSSEHRLGVVFGRERSGLTRSEVALCQRTASIKTDPSFPTMNLGVSVAYELSGGLRDAVEPKDPAPGDLLRILHQRAFDLLKEVKFLYEDNPEKVYSELRALAGRALLTEREAALLLAAIRKMEWRIGIGRREKT
jgi:TrmH family RNA methyltransferase